MGNYKGKKKRKFGWARKKQDQSQEEEIVEGCRACARQGMYFPIEFLVWGDFACPGCGIAEQAIPIAMRNGIKYVVKRRW